MDGWISLHRDIQKHWLYKEERVFSRYEAWLDILMRVNHAEGKVTHNGTLETVQRGSTIWSMGDMEKHWGWSNKKVKRFLDCLANDQMLSYRSTTKKTYLTVVNYDKYQHTSEEKAPPKHQQSTAEAFQKHTNNNVNNDNNEINTATTDPFIQLQTEFCDLHKKGDWQVKEKERSSMRSLLSQGIPIDFITDTMKKIYEVRTNEGERIKTFTYYHDAIEDAWKAKIKPFPKGGQAYAKSQTGSEKVRSGLYPSKEQALSISDDELDEIQREQQRMFGM